MATPQTDRLDSLLGQEPLAVGDIILTEVLNRSSEDKYYAEVPCLLTSLEVVQLGGRDLALEAARNFRTLRRQGVTVRQSIDTIIAIRCIEDDYGLLHSDHDFDPSSATSACGWLPDARQRRPPECQVMLVTLHFSQ